MKSRGRALDFHGKRHIGIRFHFGRKLHAVPIDDAGDERLTLCGRSSNGCVVESGLPTCIRCLTELARGRT